MNRICIMRIARSPMGCRGAVVAIGIVLLLVVGARAQQLAGSVRSVQGEAVIEAGKTVTPRAGQSTAIARPDARPAPVTRWSERRVTSVFDTIR